MQAVAGRRADAGHLASLRPSEPGKAEWGNGGNGANGGSGANSVRYVTVDKALQLSATGAAAAGPRAGGKASGLACRGASPKRRTWAVRDNGPRWFWTFRLFSGSSVTN